MKIFLVRHGETTGDIEDRYGGSYDDHLTAKGKGQIEETAKRLAGKGIEAIFSSPLIRARESAQIINKTINAPVIFIDGFKERHYGILTGLTKEDAARSYPEVVELHKDPTYTDPEGESYDDFNQRVIEAFRTISAMDHKTVAIVTHGGPIRCIHRNFGNGVLPDLLEDGHIIELNLDSSRLIK